MSDEAAADADQFMAKMIEMENMLRSFFELADICAERKRYVDALHVEYEERVQKGTEKDPEFVNRFESCPSQVHTPIFIMTETYEEEQHVNALRQNRLWVFASDENNAMKGLNHLIEDTNAIYLTTDDGRHNGDQTIAEIEAEEEEAATAVDADGSIDNEEVISSSTPRHQIVICTSFEEASRAMIELIALGANFAPTTTTTLQLLRLLKFIYDGGVIQ